jgi:hypothetical protein
MSIDPVVLSGVKLLLQCRLGLTRGENLLTFTDKTTGEFISIINKVTEKLAVLSTSLFFPVWLRRGISSEIFLNLPAWGTPREAGTILTYLSSSLYCLGSLAGVQ